VHADVEQNDTCVEAVDVAFAIAAHVSEHWSFALNSIA
jgi:hypothetical protein